jgi:hypothetical protein
MMFVKAEVPGLDCSKTPTGLCVRKKEFSGPRMGRSPLRIKNQSFRSVHVAFEEKASVVLNSNEFYQEAGSGRILLSGELGYC